MTKKKNKRKVKKKAFCLLVLLIIMVVGILYGGYYGYKVVMKSIENKKTDVAYLGSDNLTVSIYDEERNVVKEIVRGTEVKVYRLKLEDGYRKFIYEDLDYYAKSESIVDSLEKVVFEDKIYVRTSYNLNADVTSGKLLELCKKGDELTVIGYDHLLEDGNVNMYEVTTSGGVIGYFYQKYVTTNKESSLLNYDQDNTYKIHAKQSNKLGGGDGGSLDYYPVTKPTFADNVMPDSVCALYLNGTKSVISHVDDYIAYAKTTKINAFVVDIKDSGVSAYASLVMKEYSPNSYKYAQNTLEGYQEAIKKIKEAGFYVIGRITTFKDDYYIEDNSNMAISNTSGKPLKHQSSYWPSAFLRDVWEYNVELAKEAVNLMGFNEIQFDYVRFPDGMNTYEKNKTVDYRNTYNETKAQAIQRFLMYATNELHKLNVYVSCDVFGESSWGYVTAYGQYWPAISNVVDVISAMPYTDHFGRDKDTWSNPYQTVLNWAKTASLGQKSIVTPATARTWITAYNTPYWNPSVTYNGEKVADQIKALYDAGLTGGYMTWNSLSNLTKYKSQVSAYEKEYS